MKKILIFHPYLAPYRIDLYNRLNEDFEIYVLLTGSKREIRSLGFDLDLVNSQAKFKYKYITCGPRIGRHLISPIFIYTIQTFKPDIIICHELGLNTIFALFTNILNHKSKIYTTIDDSPAMAQSYNRKRECLRKFIAHHIDGFITVNPSVQDYLNRKYKSLNNKTIYFPIIQNDVILSKKINSSKELALDLQRKYNLIDKKIILFVGRLETIKCPDILIQVFDRITQKRANKEILVIIGSGSLLNELQEYTQKNKLTNVIITGKLSGYNLYAWYYLANIFILPSKYEPFGAVVNEALVAGCYTIVSEKVGASSLINQQNGCIVNTNDIDLFEKTLINSINSINQKKNHNSLMEKSFNEYYNIFIKEII